MRRAPSLALADSTWNVTSGDWSIASNWLYNVLPGTYDNDYIGNGGTATLATAGSCGGLYVGSGALQLLPGAVLTCGYGYGKESVGDSTFATGYGIVVQSGGSNACGIASSLIIANDGANGEYDLSGGVLGSTTQVVGQYHGNTGVFNQTGGTNGTVVSPPNISIGGVAATMSAEGTGTYTLSAGLVIAENETLASGGQGTFNQTGGTNIVLNNGLGNGNLAIGYFNSTGGRNGPLNNGQGTYYLSGGLLSVSPTSGGTIYLGQGGSTQNTQPAAMYQSGGTALTQVLYVGDSFVCKQATYSLSSTAGPALLSAGQEYVAADAAGSNCPSVFIQSGGSNVVQQLTLGGDGVLGTYALSGGLLQVSQYVFGDSNNINSGILFTGGTLQVGTASNVHGNAHRSRDLWQRHADGRCQWLYHAAQRPLRIQSISGSGILTVFSSSNGGTVVLGNTNSAVNSYTGGTQVLSGTLQILNAQALPNMGVLTVAGPGSIVSSTAVGMLSRVPLALPVRWALLE